MYFGTSGMILEYDGVTWRKIFIPSDTARSLALDDTGRIWAGLNGDVGYLSPDSAGTLQFVSLLDKIPAGERDFTAVWQTLPTPHGVFYRAYNKLFRWDGKQMHVWPAGAKSQFQALSEVRGHIYTSQEGVGLEEIVGDELRPVPGGDAYKDSAKLFLYPYDDGRILVSAREEALTLYDGQKVSPFPTQADAYIKEHTRYTLSMLHDGALCVTTLEGGVVVLEHDGRLRHVLDKGAGLLSTNALYSYQDREGALWLGMSNSIVRVDEDSPISILARANSLDAAKFQGSAYYTTDGSDAPMLRVITEPKTGQPTTLPYHGPTQAFAFLDFKDPSHRTPDQLLVSTSLGPMRVEGDKLVPIAPELYGIRESTFVDYQSRKTPNRVYRGMPDGLASMRWDGQKWIDEGKLPGIVYPGSDVVEDGEGNAWLSGGTGRVLHVEVAPSGMRDSKFETIGAKEGLPDGANDVQYIAGNIYATVLRSRHTYRWDSGTHKFVVDDRFLLPINSPDASVTLIPGDDNHFWSYTDSADVRRLGLFTRQPDGSWKVDEDSYRTLRRFRISNIRGDPSGVLWVAADQVVRFDPKIKPEVPPSYPTLVRRVDAGSKIVFGGTQLAETGEPKLPADTEALSFAFAALNFGSSSDTTYQYRLDGADRDWSDWTNQVQANYSGLGPGHYVFRARARAGSDQVGEEGDYAFTVLAPWYRTTAAYLGYFILLVLLALFGWQRISRYERNKARRKTEALETQAKALEVTVNERTQEIRAQAAEIAAQKDSIELLE